MQIPPQGLTESVDRAMWTPEMLGDKLKSFVQVRSDTVTKDGSNVVSGVSGLAGTPNYNALGDPLWDADGINSKPAIHLQSDALYGESVTASQPTFLLAVVDVRSYWDDAREYFWDGESSRQMLQMNLDDTYHAYAGSSAATTETVSLGPQLVAVAYNGASSEIRINGSSFSCDLGLLPVDGWLLGGKSTTYQYIKDTLFGSWCAAETNDAHDMHQIEGWAAHEYGLQHQLPSDHPYRHAAPRADLWTPERRGRKAFWLSAKSEKTKMSGSPVTVKRHTGHRESGLWTPRSDADAFFQATEYMDTSVGWEDLTGNGHDATTNISYPAPPVDVSGSHPYVFFDGSEMTLPAVYSGTESGMIGIVTFSSGGLNPGSPFGNVGSAGKAEHYPWKDGNIYADFGRDTQISFTPTDSINNQHIMVMSSEGTGWNSWMNSQEQYSDTIPSPSWSTDVWRLGRSEDTRDGQYAQYFYKGGIYAIAFFQPEHRFKFEGWAAHHYGLEASLPADHPYKNNPPSVWRNPAAQITSGQQPSFQSQGLNGHPAFVFDGSDDYVTHNYTVETAESSTVVALFEKLSANQADYESLLRLYGRNDDGLMLLTDNDGFDLWGTYDGGKKPANSSLNARGPSLLSMAESSFRLDGVFDGTYASTAGGGSVVGTKSGADGQWLDGRLSELIVIDGEGSVAMSEILEGCIAYSYDLQSQLPATHPYRYAPPHDGHLERAITHFIGTDGYWWDWREGLYSDAGSTLAEEGDQIQEWHDVMSGEVLSVPAGKGQPTLESDYIYFDQSGKNQALQMTYNVPIDKKLSIVSSGVQLATASSSHQNGVTASAVDDSSSLLTLLGCDKDGGASASIYWGSYDRARTTEGVLAGTHFVAGGSFDGDYAEVFYNDDLTASITSGHQIRTTDSFTVGALARNSNPAAAGYVSKFRHVLLIDRAITRNEFDAIQHLLRLLYAYR